MGKNLKTGKLQIISNTFKNSPQLKKRAITESLMLIFVFFHQEYSASLRFFYIIIIKINSRIEA
jgi:hypothetical protein